MFTKWGWYTVNLKNQWFHRCLFVAQVHMQVFSWDDYNHSHCSTSPQDATQVHFCSLLLASIPIILQITHTIVVGCQAKLTAGGQSDSFPAPHAIQGCSLCTMQHGKTEKRINEQLPANNHEAFNFSLKIYFLNSNTITCCSKVILSMLVQMSTFYSHFSESHLNITF